MTINRYSHSLPFPTSWPAGLKPPRVFGPIAGEATASSDDGSGVSTDSLAVESLVLSGDGLLNAELVSALRPVSVAPVDPLSADTVPASAPAPDAAGVLEPDSTVVPVESVVSLGSSVVMASSSDDPPRDSFTAVIEARQRMYTSCESCWVQVIFSPPMV
jgi:hypothetical protein